MKFKIPGAWDKEPDELDWKHEGLPCSIRRVGWSGHLCGYVGIPKDHPLYGIHYSVSSESLRKRLDDMMGKPMPDRFAVHLSALTGSINPRPDVVFDVHGGLTYSDGSLPGRDGDFWWYGFDCAHADDFTPKHPSGGVYRDFDYVKRQTNDLAEQLAAL